VTNGFGSGGKTRAESRKVEGAGTLVDLHGVAATHGDVRLGVAFEVGKIAVGAGATISVAGNFHGLKTARPDIARDEATVERVFFAGKEF